MGNSGKLYLVGTPIGNMKDMTFRAVETLNNVDYIFSEDTRHSLTLLNHFEIKKPLMSYYKQNEQEATQKVLKLLEDGNNIALITDAGMPAISDPGAILVAAARAEGYEIVSVPGATAVTTAVSLSGITSSNGFAFFGFLPPKNKDRDKLIDNIKNLCVPLVFYSAPHDIIDDLAYLAKTLGTNRNVKVAKELTKMFETVYVGTLGCIDIKDTRGEFVVIVDVSEETNPLSDMTILEHYNHYIQQGEEKKEAIKLVARDRNIKKNEVYQIIINL